MNKLVIIPLAILLLAGMLFAQNSTSDKPLVNPNVKPQHNCMDNPNLKARLQDDGTGSDRMQGLNLSDAQKKKLEELRASHQKAMNSLRAEIENLEVDIRQAVQNGDMASARKSTQLLYDKKMNQAMSRLEHLEKVLKELNDEQKTKFRAMEMFNGEPMGPMHRPGMMGKDCGPGCGMHKMQFQMQKGMMQNGQSGCGQNCQMDQMQGCKDKGQMMEKQHDCGNCQQAPDKEKPKSGTDQPKDKLPK